MVHPLNAYMMSAIGLSAQWYTNSQVQGFLCMHLTEEPFLLGAEEHAITVL